MIGFRSKKTVLVGLIVGLIVVVGVLVYRAHHHKSTPPKAGQQSAAGAAKDAKPADVTAGNFTYNKPAGWAPLDKDVLTGDQAISGIGKTAKPAATFTIKQSDAAPANNDDLKNSTLSELQKLTKFNLISSGAATANGQAGQKFIYTIGDTTKVKQEMLVVVYKQKTYFLLFSSSDSDFDSQKADFDKILSSFAFK